MASVSERTRAFINAVISKWQTDNNIGASMHYAWTGCNWFFDKKETALALLSFLKEKHPDILNLYCSYSRKATDCPIDSLVREEHYRNGVRYESPLCWSIWLS